MYCTVLHNISNLFLVAMKRHNLILHGFIFYILIYLCTDEKTSYELSLYSAYNTRSFMQQRDVLLYPCCTIKPCAEEYNKCLMQFSIFKNQPQCLNRR